MTQCMCKMMLDVADRDTMQTVVARQGDNAARFVRLALFAFGEPIRVEENAVVVLNARNAAGELRAFPGEVNCDGTLTLPFNSWMLHSVGILQCDVTIVDADGGKLTTPPFEVDVAPSVAADELLPGDSDEGESITARLLSEERVFTLEPVLAVDGYELRPLSNRKYALDLSSEIYSEGEGWKHIAMVLPTPDDVGNDSWILIYCHAPKRGSVAVSIEWGAAGEVLFVDGQIPDIVHGDFDIVCTYSRAAGKWQIGTVQYKTVGEAV
ncbi:MAG: hypothetical protein E7650_07340 [Ruminococcaceae bacterium]|nr:hypothetical protein [Oscillospiraceae bacterium]